MRPMVKALILEDAATRFHKEASGRLLELLIVPHPIVRDKERTTINS
jgi:hypothetical protein